MTDAPVTLTYDEIACSLSRVIYSCPEEARLPLLECAIDHLSAGSPRPPFLGVMDEAAFWADMASRSELKAYALTCFQRLPAHDQAAFQNFIAGKDAA